MHLHFVTIAEAVADGQDVDWLSLDLSAFAPVDLARLEELQAVADIARCFASATLGLREYGLGGAAFDQSTAPATWGGLTIRQHVGRGRFGDVFRAWDPAIERDVALKLLRNRTGGPPDEPAVIQEARLMARVRHPNVATIYGAARHDGRIGLWMEFVEGRTLQAELRDRGAFSFSEAATVGVELCRALAAVHDAGLLHRDVKAQNVLREAGGRVVLGDFGTGLALDASRIEAAPAGTPLYLAPEVWLGQPATPRSDLYSLGALLFLLVTGAFPVIGRSSAEIRRAHAGGIRTRLSELRADLPLAFVSAVERALAPEPAARYTDAQEMEAVLAACLRPQRDEPGPERPQTRRGRLLPALALLTAAFAGAVAFTTTSFGERLRRTWFSVARPAGPDAAVQSRHLSRVRAPDGQFWGVPGPDGRRFSFVDMGGDLGLFDVVSGDQQILTDRKSTGGSAFETSVFSSDGRQIAYGWENAEGVRELRIMEIATRTSRAIWQDRDDIAHPLDWSAAHDRILAVFQKRDGRRTLAVLDSAGQGISTVASVRSGFSTARLSGDGERVIFDDLQRADLAERDIFLVDLAQPGEIRPVVRGAADDFGPLWTADDRVLFVSDRTGEPSIWSIDLIGSVPGEPVILHRNMGRILPNGLGRGGTLYYTLQVGLVDIYEASLDPAREPAVDAVQPLVITQVGSKANSQWSRDGRLVYVSLPHAGAGERNVRRLAVLDPGAKAPRLLDPPLSYYLIPRWSPDGTTILVKGTDLQGKRGLFLVDATTGATRIAALIDERRPQEIGPFQWGADQRTVLFTRQGVGLIALDLTTREESPVLDFATEGITGFVAAPGFRLSRDGRTLAYSANRRNAAKENEVVLRVKSPGIASADVMVGHAFIQDWTADGQLLFTKPEGSQRTSLWRVPPTGGPAVSLGITMVGLRNASVDASGRRLTFTAGFPGSEVWALANFLPPADKSR